MKYTVSRINPKSLGKIQGAILALTTGVFVVPIVLMIALFGGSEGAFSLLFLIFPVIYGVMGFLMGALIAVVYNFVSKKIGGLEFEIDKSGKGSL